MKASRSSGSGAPQRDRRGAGEPESSRRAGGVDVRHVLILGSAEPPISHFRRRRAFDYERDAKEDRGMMSRRHLGHLREPDRAADPDRRAGAGCAASGSRARRRPPPEAARRAAARGDRAARGLLRAASCAPSSSSSTCAARRSTARSGAASSTSPTGRPRATASSPPASTPTSSAPTVEPWQRARAVGAANGRNPVSIIVPCHRVIGADGSLTGYGGGLHRKQALLELEGSGRPDPAWATRQTCSDL